MSTIRRSIGLSVVGMLSLILPVGIVAWSVYTFFMSFTEPIGIPTVKNGEMWYAEQRSTEFGPLPPSFSCQIKCRDLTTGLERPTGIRFEDDYVTPLWVGDDLYLIGTSEIYRCSNEVSLPPGVRPFRQVASLPISGTSSQEMSVFLYDGELTTCVERASGECRLVHLRDGLWVDGRKFRQPPLNCSWYDHPGDGRKMLQPSSPELYSSVAMPMGLSFKAAAPIPFLSNTIAGNTIVGLAPAPVTTLTQGSFTTVAVPLPAASVDPPAPVPPISDTAEETEPKSENLDSGAEYSTSAVPTITGMAFPVALTPATTWSFQVAQQGDHVHIFFLTNSGFCAYRDGFDFEEESESCVSALDAENVIHDPRGWEPIPLVQNGHYVQQMTCDRDGALVSALTAGLIRRSHSGAWNTVTPAPREDLNSPLSLMIDPSEKKVYVIGDSGEVLRVEENSLQPTRFKVPDSQRVYLARWQRLLLGLFGAWLLHNAIVAAGTGWLVRTATASSYEFGNQQVTLASFGRRGLALAIDLAILAGVLLLSLWVHTRFLAPNDGHIDKRNLINSLTVLESSLMYEGWMAIPSLIESIIMILAQISFGPSDFASSPLFLILLTVLVDTGVVLWLLKILDEGRYGITPGKRLLGIRTVRTTLRPSGFARALVRDLLYPIDLFLFLTPLPAAASVTFSPTRQRWGDRVADTIVSDSKSLMTVSNAPPSNASTEAKLST